MGRLIHFLILFLPLLGNILFHFKVKLHSQGLSLKAMHVSKAFHAFWEIIFTFQPQFLKSLLWPPSPPPPSKKRSSMTCIHSVCFSWFVETHRRKACLVFLWPCLSLCCALSAGMSMCILERYFWGPERPYGLEKSQLGSGIPFDSPKGLVVGPWNWLAWIYGIILGWNATAF